MKQKIAILYLNTGAGHISSAKTIKKYLDSEYGDSVQVDLVYGFERSSAYLKFSAEKMYRLSCLYFPWGFSLLYILSYIPILWYVFELIFSFSVKKYLCEKFAQEKYDKVVVLHYLLVPPARSAIRACGRQETTTLFVGVTDPFTVHPLWCFKKDAEYLVFSEKARQTLLRHRVREERIHVFSFFVDTPRTVKTPAEVLELKKQYGFAPEKKVLLITGGGDGLPKVCSLVRVLAAQKPAYSIAVVCGRNEKAFKALNEYAAKNPQLDLHVYGFVTFMADLMAVADCVVTKGGPSTVFEILSAQKPLIFVSYIFGQERGNVQFAVQNGAGWFIKNHGKIARQVSLLFENEETYRQTLENIRALAVAPSVKPCADFLFHFE